VSELQDCRLTPAKLERLKRRYRGDLSISEQEGTEEGELHGSAPCWVFDIDAVYQMACALLESLLKQ